MTGILIFQIVAFVFIVGCGIRIEILHRRVVRSWANANRRIAAIRAGTPEEGDE